MPKNMPDVLGEHLFIMLENFETIYISTNRTVPFMLSHSLQVQPYCAILCQITGRYGGSSSIPSTTPHNILCRLKISPLHTAQSSYELFSY